MLPSFVIIGAMKCGTSSLYHYLASHPDLRPSSIKETNFFLRRESFAKGVEWYESFFGGEGRYAFEASPNYTKRHAFRGVPKRMYSVLPDARLIYVLRDPIERVVSHYVHMYTEGRESRPFGEAIRKQRCDYIQSSRYFFQLEAYLKYYREENILLLEAEDLRERPAEVLRNVCHFLSIPPHYDPAVLEQRFHESSAKKRWTPLERWLIRRTDNPRLQAVIRRIGDGLGRTVQRPMLSAPERNMLMEILAPDTEGLRRFSGLPFSRWSL